MARIVSLGAALQDVYLIDHDDLTPTALNETAILGKFVNFFCETRSRSSILRKYRP